jgi:4-hydroxythreonine-4-phosphate dehydrogenase
MGDPSGVGAEIIAKAVKALAGLAEFVIIGDKWVFDKCTSAQVLECSSIEFIDLGNVEHKNFTFGKIRAEYGRASMEYLDKAMELLKKKQIDCLVTAPISKEAINLAGFHYSGHTEYFTQKTNTKDSVMMLLNEQLKFALLTQHIPLKEVSLKLNQDKICRVVSLTYTALKKLFRIKNPRIVVCGLNPHGSDNGLIGNEENKIIKPAIERLKTKLKDIRGPMGADVAIARASKNEYDCIIAMYHDQALIPLKLLGGYTGVNITLGLPFVRTSPLHGTAFDIAGKNKVDSTSLIQAIKLALQCTLNQRKA